MTIIFPPIGRVRRFYYKNDTLYLDLYRTGKVYNVRFTVNEICEKHIKTLKLDQAISRIKTICKENNLKVPE